jgi:hypothetical protein
MVTCLCYLQEEKAKEITTVMLKRFETRIQKMQKTTTLESRTSSALRVAVATSYGTTDVETVAEEAPHILFPTEVKLSLCLTN